MSDNSLYPYGCIIMASGLGKRFGSNKLLADVNGKPMIQWILDATEGLFEKRIVVTRHEAIVSICRQQNIDVILHDLPDRNDTIRLGLEHCVKEMNPDNEDATSEGILPIQGCMFMPGDQPFLSRNSILHLLAHAMSDPHSIHRLSYENTHGMPVIFPRWAFGALKKLPPKMGGSYIIRQHADCVRNVPAQDAIELEDVDTPQELRSLLQ